MFRRFSANFAVFSIFFDLILTALALLLATLIRPLLNGLSFIQPIPSPIQIPNSLYVIFPVMWVGVLMLFSVYDGRKNLRVSDEFGSLSLGALLAAVALAGVLYFSFRDVSRFLFFMFVVICLVLQLTWRVFIRMAFRWNLMGPAQQRRVLILGAGVIGERLREEIQRHSTGGLIFAGFLDDNPAKKSNERVLGTLDDARAVIAQEMVDDVVMALPLSAHKRLNQVVAELHDIPVRVWVVPDYFALALHKASVEEFAGIPMLDLRAPALSEYQRMVKRAFDLTVSVLILPFALIIMAVVAILIRLDTPGPVFFRQKRVGEDGKLFNMIKFRTMVEGADRMQHLVEEPNSAGQVIHKRPDDPRVTRVGKFLRKTSLDELPQIFNVLRGTMSWVGPRPEMPYLVDKYAPWQRKRFTVPQGITGWWQINGRSDRPMHLHTEDDLFYVQHYSIWLDIQILFLTLWVVLKGKGAY